MGLLRQQIMMIRSVDDHDLPVVCQTEAHQIVGQPKSELL